MTTTDGFRERLYAAGHGALSESEWVQHVSELLSDMEAAFTRSAFVSVQHIAGIKEVAEFFNVGRPVVAQWHTRQKANGMPDPLKTLGMGTVWDLEELVQWWVNWTPARGAKSGTLPLDWKNRL